jgi:hypothetical protein
MRLNPRGHRIDILLIARQERNKFFVIDTINKLCTVAHGRHWSADILPAAASILLAHF